ncbi:MAG: hypothetical protein U9R79_11580 [Armatimonadota bacterium]|nr:hypothetical protein [Armatimonadota bacterium]
MERTARRRRVRIEHLVWAVMLYCGVVAAMWPKRTYDIWWHLATGKYIVQTRTIPDEDPFTYTRTGRPWITHEWGWEVPMYLLYARWGHAGLMALRAMVALVASGLLAWLLLRRGAAPLAAMAAGALAIFAARPLLNDRPQMATTALFVAMLCVIEHSRQGRHRWLLAAPLLMIPWVNLHGGFIFGPALLVLYALCTLPQWYRQRREGRPLQPAPALLIGVIVASLPACLVNPHGVAGAAYPLQYVIGGHAWHKTIITEYESPDFSEPIFLFLGLLIVAAAVAFAASRRRAGLWDVALVGVFLFLTLKWQRNTALFAFAVAPVVALQLSELLEWRGLAELGRGESQQPPAGLYVAIMAILSILAIAAAPNALSRVERAFAADMPGECVDHIQRTGLQGRMFNTYRWGGYLIWRLWPQQRVFVDGRADVMGQELIEDYCTAVKLREGWRDVVEAYDFDWALLAADSPLCRGLELLPEWSLECESETSRLYVRSSAPETPTEQ